MLTVRRISKQVRKWTDKSVPKHRHEFTEDCVVEVNYRGHMFYYSANKCKFCSSFCNAEVILENKNLNPDIKLIARHCTIGFNGCYLSDI